MYLTFVSEDTVFDSIPLAEISSVQQINETTKSESVVSGSFTSTLSALPLTQQPRQSPVKSADSSQTRFQHAFQLKTIPNGFNSGRTYYFQAASDEQCRVVCQSISCQSRRAREDAAKISSIRRAQARVAAMYESTTFQSGVAVLIVTVHTPSAHLRPVETKHDPTA
jgi:hypothetical protein